jgi:hypothetical protein
MEWLAEYTGSNVWVRWQELEANGVERDKPISLKVHNLRLAQILWMILTEAGGSDVKLGYGVSENLLVVSTRDDLNAELIVKVYDVRDIVNRIPSFDRGPRIDGAAALENIGRNGTGGTGLIETPTDEETERSTPEDEMARFIDIITTSVEPESWSPNGRGTIVAWRGKIIVRNSIYVHQLLGGALKDIDAP